MPLFEPEIDRELVECTQLANGYQLLKRRQVEGIDIVDSQTSRRVVGELALQRALSADLYLGVKKEDVDYDDFEKTIEQSNKKVDRLLLALNINEKLWSFPNDMRLSWFQDRSRGLVNARQFWPRSNFEAHPTLDDVSKASELTITIDTAYLAEPESKYGAVKTALFALQLGSYHFNTSIRYLQECIALEALCSGSDTEVTHRIATACAILLGTEAAERKELYKLSKRLYGIRSRIIHGTGKRAKIEELKDIEQLTRKIVRRLLTHDILPNFETDSKQREFLLELSLEKTASASPSE